MEKKERSRARGEETASVVAMDTLVEILPRLQY
jgi:hypothetical protein